MYTNQSYAPKAPTISYRKMNVAQILPIPAASSEMARYVYDMLTREELRGCETATD